MIIKFSPQIREDIPVIIKTGNIISIDGEELDLDVITNWTTVPNEAINTVFIQEIIKDELGHVTITLLWAYTEDSDVNGWPADLIDPVDGVIEPIASIL